MGRTGERSDEVQFRLMFERSADAILLLDAGTNQFVQYNQAALDMLRCTTEELAALHPSALSPARQPDGRESFAKANEMIETAVRLGSHRFEWLHCSPHRAPFPVEVLLTPLSLERGSTIVVVWRDITERKQAEEALRQTQKLESLGVLAGGIAHDFNNLLMAIVGHLHLTRSNLTRDTAAATEHLATMEQAVHRAADLTRQLLAYSGRGTFLVEPVDLAALLRELSGLLRVSMSKHVRLISKSTGDNLFIEGDRGQLQQVLMNLLTNASEAIGASEGDITLEVREATLDVETVRTRYPGQPVQPGRVVLLSVSDTGQGMSLGTLARLFDPFFSTKAAGRGLGLSAVRGILAKHRAGLSVRSEPGRGSTFEVAFPSTTRRPASLSSSPTLSTTARRRRVLLVDDDPHVRSSLAAVLTSFGFEVTQSPDGASAIAQFERQPDQFGWVLMDLTMPGLDGYETFLELKKREPAVKVVLCSGWAEDEVSQRFSAAPPAGFLPKPFTHAQLESLLLQLGLVDADATGG